MADGKINPERKALDGIAAPHDLDAYRCFITFPPATCVWCSKSFPSVRAYRFRDARFKAVTPLCPECWETKTEDCAECAGVGSSDSGAPTPWGGYYHVRCMVCEGRGRLSKEEVASLKKP